MKERILQFDAREAKEYFLASKNYFTVPMPEYFEFDGILREMDARLDGRRLEDFATDVRAEGLAGVNFVIATSKNGGYGWRPFQLIHPAMYVRMVHLVTEPQNWEKIRTRYRLYGKCSAVTCTSMMPAMGNDGSGMGSSIMQWWCRVEQTSIKLALFYDYMMQTDIMECYNTMPVRLVERAFGGELGCEIGRLFRMMAGGAEVGIPQGSGLVDFIAEVTLGYLDVILARALKKEKVRDYTIIRYRDDYRVFAEDTAMARKAVRVLADVLAKFGMKINPEKTVLHDDIIAAARKSDKNYWEKQQGFLTMAEGGWPREFSIQKELIAIREMAIKYQNAGSVQRAMVDLYKRRIVRLEHRPHDAYPMIAITADIMVRTPRTYQVGVAILTKLMSFNPGMSRNRLVDRIREKARVMPNIDYLEIWLQRLTSKNKPGKKFGCELCRMLYEPNVRIWNSDWLDLPVRDEMMFRRDILKSMEYVMPADEIEIFGDYDSADDDFEGLVKNREI